MKAVPLEFHKPGWRVELDGGESFTVWGPQTQEDVDHQGGTNPPRPTWSAAWQSADGWDGSHERGSTLNEALRAFDSYPDPQVAREVRDEMRIAVKEAELYAERYGGEAS